MRKSLKSTSRMEMPQQAPGTVPPAAPSEDPQSFKMYAGKAPLLVQIFGGLLWLNGLSFILSGLASLLLASRTFPVLALGALQLIIGVLTITYARGLFKMRKSAYRGAMAVVGLGLAVSIYFVARDARVVLRAQDVASVALSLLALIVLYAHRERFVDAPKA